jgi:7-cyano-7-deazaguanine synthase in queuosine biosynthesis
VISAYLCSFAGPESWYVDFYSTIADFYSSFVDYRSTYLSLWKGGRSSPGPHLFYAAHAGDHAIYPDCRPVFVSAMEKALHLCDWHDLTLHAPYLHLSKADILKIGINLGVDSSLTWTCYKGEERACGKCHGADRGVPDRRSEGSGEVPGFLIV